MRNLKSKIILVFFALAFGLVFVLISLPSFIDQRINSILPVPTKDRNVQIPELHKTLFIGDLHADTLLWNRPLLKEGTYGHVDLPRLQKGGVALQTFSVVTETPLFPNYDNNKKGGFGVDILTAAQGWPPRTWGSLSEKAIYQAEKLQEAVRDSNGEMRLILTHHDLMRLREDRQRNEKLVGAWLSIEGGHVLHGDLSLLDQLYEKGFRMIGPAHFFDNEIVGSQSGEKKEGLTELGREWVKEMEQRKMIIDLSHVSKQGFAEILKAATKPPLVSHTGIEAVCPISRNLSDEQIIQLAAKGGIIGIGLWKQALCDRGLDGVVESIRHVCNLVGCQYVALGSDWDGFVTTAVDAAHIGFLTYELQKAGFSESDIRGIMGETLFQFLIEYLP